MSFAKKTAAALASGSPAPDAERELAYVAQLQAQLGAVPLHKAVEFYRENAGVACAVSDSRIDTLLPVWLAALEANRASPSYLSAVTFYCTPFAKAFPGMIRGITSTDIDAWISSRTKSLFSRKHYLQSIITLFRWARDVKKALPKGDTEPELLPMPKPKASPIRIYTPEEGALFLKYACGEEIPLVVIGGWCGLRSSEITGDRTAHGPLQCEDILFREQAVRVTQKVQDESVERYAPLTENAARRLEKYLRGKSGPVWDTITTPFHVLERLIARIRAAGHAVRRLRNGFRRSFISYRTAVTRDVARVADECNTSPAKIAKNYRKPGLESVGHAWFAL